MGRQSWFIAAVLIPSLSVLATLAAAQTPGVERRPCVNPSAPTGCDSTLRMPPQPMTSFPDSPLMPETRQAFGHIPLHAPPEPPESQADAEPNGTVTVNPLSPPAAETTPTETPAAQKP